MKCGKCQRTITGAEVYLYLQLADPLRQMKVGTWGLCERCTHAFMHWFSLPGEVGDA